MAYTTINKSTDYFNTKLYTGTGSSNAITGINFQPDLTWIKKRDGTNYHVLTDAVRLATKQIYSNDTGAEQTVAEGLKSFDSDGFTLGTNGDTNGSGGSYVGWNWKANGAGSSNSDGNGITSTVSANATAGFSIVKYTGTGNAAHTIGHGLGVKPACVIMRPLSYGGAWWIVHKDLTADNVLEFNTNAQANISGFGGGGLKYSTFTTSVIGGGNGSSNSDLWNKSGEDYIAYCFAEKVGYSKFSSYTSNGQSGDSAPFIYTGFKPALFICKRIASAGNWMVYDNKRDPHNQLADYIYWNSTQAGTTNSNGFDFVSNGIKIRNNFGDANTGTETFIYMAFAEAPLVGSNNVPCTAR